LTYCNLLSRFRVHFTVLVGPHDGAVDHQVFIFGVAGQLLEQPFPDPAFGPAAEATVGVFPIAEPLRRVAPNDPGAGSIENGLDKPTVVAGGCADISWLSGQQVLDPLPLIVAKSISVMRQPSIQPTLHDSHNSPSC
jgi:hypothetical protein